MMLCHWSSGMASRVPRGYGQQQQQCTYATYKRNSNAPYFKPREKGSGKNFKKFQGDHTRLPPEPLHKRSVDKEIEKARENMVQEIEDAPLGTALVPNSGITIEPAKIYSKMGQHDVDDIQKKLHGHATGKAKSK